MRKARQNETQTKGLELRKSQLRRAPDSVYTKPPSKPHLKQRSSSHIRGHCFVGANRESAALAITDPGYGWRGYSFLLRGMAFHPCVPSGSWGEDSRSTRLRGTSHKRQSPRPLLPSIWESPHWLVKLSCLLKPA